MKNIIPTQEQKVKEKLSKLEKNLIKIKQGKGVLKSYVYIK